METEHVIHPFDPVFDSRSRILVLGTFPSVKSRQGKFYYHHPRNRFWKVLCALTGEPLPASVEEKRAMLIRRGVALWDVISSCDIKGSGDSSIKNVVPARLSLVLEKAQVRGIYANGDKAYRLYQRYQREKTGREIVRLPSTSPANAACSLESLIESWSVILKDLQAET